MDEPPRHGLRRRVTVGFGLFLLAATPLAGQRDIAIQNFDVAIDVSPVGTIGVTEKIALRFRGSWNGIERYIPIQYRTALLFNYTLRLSVSSITEGLYPLRYRSRGEKQYRKLQIWVPGASDTIKTVVISYQVDNALRFFDGHDELYWNVTGDEWDMPIYAATGVVRLPPSVTGIRTTAFLGPYGSTESAAVASTGTTTTLKSPRPLGSGEGLTMVVGWNPGVVRRPTTVSRTLSFAYSNIMLLTPLVVLTVMLALWRVRGRDPKLAPIVTRYEPPDDLGPAELGTLADLISDRRDITATVVDLAVRGCLHISELAGQDYRFTLRKPSREWGSLKPHERRILGGLFGVDALVDRSVTLSELKDTFHEELPGINDELYDMLVLRGFYARRPDNVRSYYIVVGLLAGIGVWVVSAFVWPLFGMQPAGGIIGGLATTLVMWVVGVQMPAMTESGARELEKVLGFKEFLSRVDADRLQRIKATPQMFEKFLPYAMVLGVEEHWAKMFDDLRPQAPEWYTGYGDEPDFRPTRLSSSLTQLTGTASSVLRSARRSADGSGFSSGDRDSSFGGGFSDGQSGGGFGGGGGKGF